MDNQSHDNSLTTNPSVIHPAIIALPVNIKTKPAPSCDQSSALDGLTA
jgi:hypothetical protein